MVSVKNVFSGLLFLCPTSARQYAKKIVDALARASASAPFSPKAQHEMASGLDPSEHEQPCSSACPTPKSKLNFHSSSPSLVAFEGLGNG